MCLPKRPQTPLRIRAAEELGMVRFWLTGQATGSTFRNDHELRGVFGPLRNSVSGC